MKQVQYLTQKNDSFSNIYLEVRKKEQRIYEDEIVKNLPNVSTNHIYKKEWDLRIRSTNRIINYLKEKNKPLKILDIGCGNGWFSNCLSEIVNSTVFAVDINAEELEQANRVFQQENLTFLYADIFIVNDLTGFDIITINSCIQYFNDIERLIKTLKSKLNSNGEIHILDSPFYKEKDMVNAKKRTLEYYTSLGLLEMAKNYFHHSFNDLGNYKMLYSPKKSFSKILFKNDVPFPWIRLR